MERRIKKIPVFMDILFEDFLDQEQVKRVLSAVSKALSDSKGELSLTSNKVKEIRFLVKGNVLIRENLETGERSSEDLAG